MPRYQLYLLETNGRIAEPALERRCANDTEALLLALDVSERYPAVEVWAEDRVVGRVTAREAEALRDRMRGREPGLLVNRGMQARAGLRFPGMPV